MKNSCFLFPFLIVGLFLTSTTVYGQETITFDDQGFTGCQVIADNYRFNALGQGFNIFAANFDGTPSANGVLNYETATGGCWHGFSSELDGGYVTAGYADGQGAQQWYHPEALVIKSTDGSEFKLTSFKAHDAEWQPWGNYLKITGYVDGVEQASESVVIVSHVDPYHSTVTLIDPVFDNVDEVRITMDKDSNPDFDDPEILKSDAEGLFHSFDTFVVDNAVSPNQAPTDISLSSSTVNQSGGVNAAVGTLSTTDPDGGDVHSYSLVPGTGGDDNDSFNINGSDLRADDAAGMAPGSYSVRIQTNDGTDTYQKVFTITVADDVAPSFENSTPSVSATTVSQTTLTVRLNEVGTAYYVVIADGDGAPSSAQVKAGQNSGGEAPVLSGTINVSSGSQDFNTDITGLSSSTAYDIYVMAEDDEGTPNLQASPTKVDVTTLNAAPVFTALADAVVSTNEDTAVEITFADISTQANASDSDGTVDAFVVQMVNSGTLTINGSAYAADTNDEITADQSALWTPSADANGILNAFTIIARDNNDVESSPAVQAQVDVTAVNDAPELTGLPADVTVTENTASDFDLSPTTFADIDGDALTITLSASAGTFAASSDAGVTTGGSGTGSLTLSGTTVALNIWLDTPSNIQYTGAFNASGDNAATFTVNADDGTVNPQVGSGNIDISAVNNAPVFAGLDAAPSYTEDGSAISLDDNVTISDTELDALNTGNGNYDGAGMSVSRDGGQNADDRLSIESGGNLTVVGGSAGGGTISAGGNVIGTIANTGNGLLDVSFDNNGTIPTTELINEVLQAIRYFNASDDPAGSVVLNWSFSDGNSGSQGSGPQPGSDTGSTTVTVTNVNDAPNLTATGSNPAYVEGAAAAGLYNTVTASVIEAGQQFSGLSLTVTNVSDGASEILHVDGSDLELTDGFNVPVTATNDLDVSVSVAAGTATVGFTGASLSETQMQTLVDNLAYRNISDDPSSGSNRVVTITEISDDGGETNGGDDTASLAITSTVSLTAVNDAPVMTGLDGDNSGVQAGGASANIDHSGDATLTNPDSDNYNGGFLTITDNGDDNTANGNFGVDGTNATSGGNTTIAAGENIAVGGIDVGTVHATDDGQGGNRLTIDFTNANATSANIQTLIRNLRWESAAGSGAQTFTLTLNDGDGTDDGGAEETTADFTMTLGNPPVIAGLDGDEVDFLVDGPAVLLDANNDAALTDADAPANLNGGNLRATVTTNAATGEDILSLNTTGTVALGDITAGTAVNVGATVIGTLGNAIAAGNDLVVNFNADATSALVQTLLQNLQYANNASPVTEASRQVQVTVTDDQGLTSVPATMTITTVANQPPTLTATATDPDFTEGGVPVGLYNGASASSVEAGQALTGLSLSVSNVSDGASETVNVDGSDVALTDGNTVTTATHGLTAGVSVTGSTATVSFSGASLTPNQAETLINGLTYVHTGDDTGSEDRVVTIVELVDSGGTANGGDDTADLSITSTVSITDVNDAPTLTTTGDDPSFNENDSPVGLFSGTSISAIETGQTLAGFIFLVTPVNDAAEEFLVADGTSVELTNGAGGTTATNGLTYAVTTSGAGVTVTFTGGTFSTNETEAFVDALAYHNTAVNPDETDRDVTLVEMRDSGGTANGGSDTITPGITSTVDVTDLILPAPELDASTPAEAENEIALDTKISLSLDQAVSIVDVSGVTITDQDNTPVTDVMVSLSGDQILEIAYDALVPDRTYTVTLPAGAVQNIDGVVNTEISVSFSTVEQGTAIASQTTAEVPDEGLTGEVTVISITVRDAFDNRVPGVAGQLSVAVSSGPNEGISFSSISDNGDGVYTTSYTPSAAGTDQIAITIDGDPIENSPFTHEVVPDVVPPDAPMDLLAQAGDTEVALNWQPPADDGDGTISGYTIQYSTNGGAAWSDAAGSGPSTERTITGLTNNLGHLFRVAAVNEAGRGAFSDPSEYMIPTAPVPDPSGGFPELDPGLAEALQDGTSVQFNIVRGEDGTLELIMAGGGFGVALASLDPENNPIPLSSLDDQFRLILGEDASFLVTGQGFEPGSFVTVWLFSDPMHLGTIEVGEDGSFEKRLPLSQEIEPGSHTLQVRGRGQTGQERSVNVGIMVVELHAPTNTSAPAITNSQMLRIGMEAEADPGEWAAAPDPVFSTRWLRCTDPEQPVAECTPVEGATGPSYEISPQDLGYWLRISVTVDNGIHAPITATSATSGPVGAGSVSASSSSAEVPDGLAGNPTVVTIRLEDAHGNPVSGEAGNLTLAITDGPNKGEAFSEVEDQGNGTYSAGYTPELPGIEEISITLNGEPVGQSPFISQIGPLENSLAYNYPNPFSGSTTIEYSVTDPSKVTLRVFDVLGRVVQTLVDIPSREPGEYSFIWNTDGLASGTYYYQLVITPAEGGKSFVKTRALMQVR